MTAPTAIPLFILLPLLLGCHGARQPDLGVRDGKLSPCPSTLNCVSSQASDEEHRVKPLTYRGSATDAMERLSSILRSLPRTTVVIRTDTYLHAECASIIFRFIDDVEFLVDKNTKIIDVRSASRLGRWDLGVNRERIESIRSRWNEAKDR